MVENCSSWNARLIRICETFNEAENASMFGNSLRIVVVLNILSRNGRFSAKKRFSLNGHATFRRVLIRSQSEETGHFGTTKFCPI